MKNKRRIAGIVLAPTLAIIGTVALVGYVHSAKDKAVAAEAQVDVYVVDKLVPKGADAETIKSSVSLEHIPSRLEQPGAVTKLDDVGANVASADLEPGDQLVKARLVPKDQVSAEVKDKVQIATPVLAPERAVGGALAKGDLVGVYLSFDPDSSVFTDNVTRLEFQHVLVTDVHTTDAPVVTDTKDKNQQSVEQVSGSQYVVTLALSPEQSERFVFATEFGHVWLSNDPATVSDDGTRLVTLGNVYSVAK
jgi:pilus assembly protein CpaB